MTKTAEIFESMDYGPAPESPAWAQDWIKAHGGKFDHYIGGRFVASAKYFATSNPATGAQLGELALGTAEDVDAAVKSARKAFDKSWSKTSGHERAKYLYALARLVQKHSRLFAVLESMDNGKTIRETRDIDIPLVARHFYHHAGWAQLLDTEFPGHVPYGVCGQIIPWNFPLLMLAWKVAPALAAGNTVVLKPAEFTSLTAVLFAEICREAGLPDGVVNIVLGDGSTGAALVKHGGIDKLAFTGSTEVGRIIRKESAGSGKALTLELGGKSPIIVFDDADLDAVTEGVVDAIWFNQGQVCCGGSRLLVQEGVYDRLIKKLKRKMETLRLGDPMDKCMDIGAIVDEVQRKRIAGLVEQGRKEGGTVHTPSTWTCPEKGCFYPPTLITDVQSSSTVMQEEIFGPVISAMSFRTPDEAVELANNTRYGLAAGIWSENINLALEMAPKLKCGVVWINCTNAFDAASGFGGYRESGFGREGGKEGMYAYLKPAYVKSLKPYPAPEPVPEIKYQPGAAASIIDRTPKLYIGGKQARPDGNYVYKVVSPDGALVGEAGEGNRKDIRNAVEAARKAEGWASATGHLRAQILYYMGENLSARKAEFADRIRAMTGAAKTKAADEVEASIRRLFTYGAFADKYDGAVHATPMRNVTVAMNEPIGILAAVCPDEAPLLAFISLLAPAMALGNRVVMLPSERYPLAATDFYQVLDTSDVPGGVVNIVTGPRKSLVKTLAEHDNIDAIWCFAPEAEHSKQVEALSTGNLKRSWVNNGLKRDWHNPQHAEGREFLRQASQVKNIWVPYGEVG
jgi:aldehyde dehydrogenase (NAD+)